MGKAFQKEVARQGGGGGEAEDKVHYGPTHTCRGTPNSPCGAGLAFWHRARFALPFPYPLAGPGKGGRRRGAILEGSPPPPHKESLGNSAGAAAAAAPPGNAQQGARLTHASPPLCSGLLLRAKSHPPAPDPQLVRTGSGIMGWGEGFTGRRKLGGGRARGATFHPQPRLSSGR